VKGPLDPALEMRRYAAATVDTLIRRLAFQINRTGKRGDPDSVHDLRVAIRRLSQGLDVFSTLFPKSAARKVDRKIDKLRRLAGQVRDLDITLEYYAAHEGRATEAGRLTELRKKAFKELSEALSQAGKREPWRKWRTRLGLES
jgi:CHAD domain-containing protein